MHALDLFILCWGATGCGVTAVVCHLMYLCCGDAGFNHTLIGNPQCFMIVGLFYCCATSQSYQPIRQMWLICTHQATSYMLWNLVSLAL